MNFRIIGTIFILSFFLLGCNIFSYHKRAEKKRVENMLEDWRRDTSGCLNIRSSEKLHYLRECLVLDNKSKSFVLKKLGEPNIIVKDGNKETYRYYYNGLCNNEGQLIESSDYCWIEISFSSNKIIYIASLCF